MKSQKPFLILLGVALITPPLLAQDSVEDRQKKALEVLRRTIDEQQKSRGIAAPPSRTTPPPRREPTFAEIERQYLEGRITAKQFQRYLHDHKIEPVPTSPSANTAAPAPGPELARKEAAKSNLNPSQAGAIAHPGAVAARTNTLTSRAAAEVKLDKPEATPEQSALIEVEKKMDELLRLKAARDQATNSASNATTNSAGATAPKTKRQRLDDLLKSFIEGKIPEAEYQQKRAKVIAEPN